MHEGNKEKLSKMLVVQAGTAGAACVEQRGRQLGRETAPDPGGLRDAQGGHRNAARPSELE